ncbi:MAG: hypothetical protein WCL04_07960, partial [Verrucomicrobiota bacterium]
APCHATTVLANFFSLFTRRSAAEDYHRAFVAEVRPVVPRVRRSRRSERVLVLGWVLVGLKCWGVWRLVQAYHDRIPFGAWWINTPTLVAAALVTWVYLRRP